MLQAIVFSTTYQCPVTCRYCGAECSPERKEKLTLEDMLSIIDTVRKYGQLDLVVFTGGEPFLLGDTLLRCVQYCHDRKILTRIVTNAYWATSIKVANEKISRFKMAGLSEINISCDDYHQEFIPLERVKYAHDACVNADLRVLLAHKKMKDYVISMEYLDEYFGKKLTRFEFCGENPENHLILSSYTVPVSKDMHLIPDEEILYPDVDDWKGSCSTILQRVIITPRKELSICCGMIPRKVKEVVFGTLDDHTLEELIVKAQSDLFVNWLALEGPYGIMKFIQEKAPEIVFRKRYVNICHLCSEIFTREDCREVLMEYAEEKVSEIWSKRTLYNVLRETEVQENPKMKNDNCQPCHSR